MLFTHKEWLHFSRGLLLRKKSLLKKHVKSEGALKSPKNPSMFYSVDDSGIMYSVDSSEEEHR